ncbi:hypothetical protein HGRIS_008789 [Hohenbuehelia grisea]|uniref:Uncharacterized protein n=1 Tax=Hohenbuehelia grisea TaxID=104357 RepID=A0ABR3J9F2_9AGAR
MAPNLKIFVSAAAHEGDGFVYQIQLCTTRGFDRMDKSHSDGGHFVRPAYHHVEAVKGTPRCYQGRGRSIE